MILGTNSIEEFISRYQIDGIIWKANRLLLNENNPVTRNNRCMEVATMLSYIPDQNGVMRDDYVKRICEQHGLKTKTLEKMIADAIGRRLKAENKKARKNKVKSLDTNPKTFPFFKEFISENTKTKERFLDKIKFDKLRFVQLLASFGFSRFETESDTDKKGETDYNYVHITDNIISSVNRNMIIDYVEKFLREQYDFDAAKCEFVDADTLITSLYDQMRTIFSKDLFARVRTDAPLIINQDKSTATFLYFKNGFVRVTSDDYELLPYTEMDGSIWNHQMKNRTFKKVEHIDELLPLKDGQDENFRQEYKCVFMDFVWKISGRNADRFKSLCCIIGYILHDFYQYELKMIYFTDSTISDHSEGRTGKTLLMKMIGHVRSFIEINGKNFDPNDQKRYETVQLGTQVVHINDVSNKGHNRFDIEPMFNDITEGLMVRALYMAPFRQWCKLVTSGNKSLFIGGDSAKARVLEFELSNFFSIRNKPVDFYGHWLGNDWNAEEWNRFDNFICVCAKMFHLHGLQDPPTINLGERKLKDHTSNEFLEFWDNIKTMLKEKGKPWDGYQNENATINPQLNYPDLTDFVFDRKKLHDQFLLEYEDFKNARWFTVRKFNQWIELLANLRYGVTKPKVWKSGGITYVQLKQDEK